jgi:endonuclease/exonuclease/phosphatase family metal-dependent hydrolase/nicotinic acid mononucleotide adenylyltransferase
MTNIVVHPQIEIGTDSPGFLKWSRTRRVYTDGLEAHIDKQLLIWHATLHNDQARAMLDSNGEQWTGSVQGSWYTGTRRQRIEIKSAHVFIVVDPGTPIGTDNPDFLEWSRSKRVFVGGSEAPIDRQLLIWYSTLHHGQARALRDSHWERWEASVQGSWYIETNDRQRIVIQSQQCAVLLLTGALNPVHNGHLEMLAFARSELQGIYSCVRPVLSPSHDDYVGTKEGARPFADRVQFARAVEGVTVSEWEGRQAHFVDYPEVLAHFEATEVDADVFYIVGEDHYHAHVKTTMHNNTNVIVAPRTSQDISSTLVRSVSGAAKLRSLVPPRVADLIITSQLYGFSEPPETQDTIQIYSYNIQYDGNPKNHRTIVQSLFDNLHRYSVVCLQEVPAPVWKMVSRASTILDTHAWMYKAGEVLGVARRLQPVFQDAFFPVATGITKYSVNQRPFLCATIQVRNRRHLVVGTAHVWSIFGELECTTNRTDIDLKISFLEQCFTYMESLSPVGATLLLAGDTNLVDEPWTRDYEDQKLRSLHLTDLDSRTRVRTWDGTTNSNVPTRAERHRPDRVFMREPSSQLSSTLEVQNQDMRSDHFPIIASVPIEPRDTTWDPAAVVQMCRTLRACYTSGYAFPAWTLQGIPDQEALFRATHVYYGDSTDTDEPDLAVIQRLIREREPVNIGMRRRYNQEALHRGFGHRRGYYGTLAESGNKLPPSVAVYTKTLVGLPGSHAIVHLLHAIGLGFDAPAQPDLQLLCAKKLDCVTFYRYMFHLIFTCADDQLGPDSIVVLSLVGGNAFAKEYPGGFRQLWIDAWIPALKSHLQAHPLHVQRLRGMGFPSAFLELVSPIIHKQLQSTKRFPDIIDDYDLHKTLFVNAWDPWSVVGNGNEQDNSLDGHIGRHSNAAILSTSMTNPFLQTSALYTFVKKSKSLNRVCAGLLWCLIVKNKSKESLCCVVVMSYLQKE